MYVLFVLMYVPGFQSFGNKRSTGRDIKPNKNRHKTLTIAKREVEKEEEKKTKSRESATSTSCPVVL